MNKTIRKNQRVRVLQCDSEHRGCLERLMEDIPELMEEHL